ncbi:hypothetical protein Tco_0562682 [Tanacetum coccineum]
MVKQVFLDKEVVVDGMERNLSYPLGVTTGNHGQVLEHLEPRILFFNGNTYMEFQRISEYGLATSVQLLRMHNIIVQDSNYARQVATELMLVIESRHDYFEAKDIVEKNLDNYDFGIVKTEFPFLEASAKILLSEIATHRRYRLPAKLLPPPSDPPPPLMNLLFSFIEPEHPYSALLEGCFMPVVAKDGSPNELYSSNVPIAKKIAVIIRLIGADEHLDISYDCPEVHVNATEALCAITRYAPPGLFAKISSPSFIGRLFRHSLEDSWPKSVLVNSLSCGHNSKLNAAKMLDEIDRVLKKDGVYILITYGIPAYRLRLLRESHSWDIKLHVIDKLLKGEDSKSDTWELTHPVPLNSDGSLKVGSPLENMDVHYIYVCPKVSKTWCPLVLHFGPLIL